MPFTVEQFLEVFAAYNGAVYPTQFFLAAAALIAIFLSIITYKNSSRFVSAMLAFYGFGPALFTTCCFLRESTF